MEIEYADRVKQMKPSIIRELLKQMSDPGLISFAGGNPASEAFPAKEIALISDILLKEKPIAVLQYSVTEGIGELRLEAKKYMNSMFNVAGDDDEIIVTSGSQQAMDYLTKLVCNPDDTVATEDPAFLGAHNCFRSYGLGLKAVPMESDGVNLDALEKALTQGKKPKFFYTIPNFQNPTGYTTGLEKRKKIYELCVANGVLIFEDNPYGELRISGDDIPPIKSFDRHGAVVYAASFSKILSPGLRISFCAAQKELIHKMVVAKQSNDIHTNVWAQQVALEFMRRYDMNEHISRLRKIYRDKAQMMMNEIDAKLGGRVTYIKPEGGMFIWLTLPDDIEMQEFVKNCLADKLAIVPGNAFMVDGEAPCQSVRLNFTTPSAEQITAGVEIMRKNLFI